MGRLGHPEFVPTLGSCLRADWIPDLADRDLVQIAAIQALVGYLDDEAAAVLLEGLGWIQDEDTREYCFKALETIRRYQEELEAWNARKQRERAREQAVTQLLAMLDSDNDLTRANAVRSLATLGAVEHMHRIVLMLEDPDGRVSDAARQALEVLGTIGAPVSPPDEE
jgi:HEAT repeat protein